jgi:DNA-binding CsgD family transcriptional regulator
MRSVTGRLANPEMTNAELGAIALRVADCRSLAALPQAIFSRADALFGVAAMGLYLFDRTERLQLIASRLASPGFLDQCEREFPTNSMLDCIVTERRTIDGFHFYGAARWRRSSTYDLLHGWGYHHNMGGALAVGGRVVGAVFVGTAENDDPYDAVHVKRLDLLCRASSVALTAMSERERLRSELSDSTSEDRRDLLSAGNDRPARAAAGGAAEIELRNTREHASGGPFDRLPARSRAVALLVCEGQSNKAIARQLGISAHTVKEHVHNLCRRFGALNRTDLVHRLLVSSNYH